MLPKTFLGYLQYLFWGQLLFSLLSIIFFVEGEMSIPVIQKQSDQQPAILIASQIREIKPTGFLVTEDVNPLKAALLSQTDIALPVGNSLAAVLTSIIFSVVMLLFFRDLKRGNRFTTSLSRYLRINGWLLVGYIVADIALGSWRWSVVESMTSGAYLPLERMNGVRYAWIFCLLLFLFAAAFKKANRLEEEQNLTI